MKIVSVIGSTIWTNSSRWWVDTAATAPPRRKESRGRLETDRVLDTLTGGGRLRGEGGGYCCQWKQVGRNGDDKLSDFMWTKESVSPLGRPDLANRNENEGEEGRGGTEFVEENDAAERRRNASSTCLTVITRARVHLLSAA